MELPIDELTRNWIEARSSWIVSQFTSDSLRSKKVVVPTTEFLPASYDASKSDVERVLSVVCELMEIDSKELELCLYRDATASTAGLYERIGDGHHRIWVETSVLRHPLRLVSTLAHELAHVHLIGGGRLKPEQFPDHEPLTDLLVVFFGLGVVCANEVLHEEHWKDGPYVGWYLSRKGYLTMQDYGYALALHAQFRKERQPAWRSHLRLDVRKYFDQSMRYLDEWMPDLELVNDVLTIPALLLDRTSEGIDECSSTIEEGSCVFCGSVVKVDDQEVCEECQLSIEENTRELEAERLEEERKFLIYERRYKIGCALVPVLFVVAFLLKCLGLL